MTQYNAQSIQVLTDRAHIQLRKIELFYCIS